MLVVLSADMEAIAGVTDILDVLASSPSYWERGRAALAADVAAAARGLLDGGASEVVVLDNHGSGNPQNIAAEDLPPGARLETWNVFDVSRHAAAATFQVGYHPRGGLNGFISHTYVPNLRLRLDDELISESHGRAWAADGAPLLGIVGNETHRDTVGSLANVPFLPVQISEGRTSARPVFPDPQESAEAIRSFAADCMREAASAPRLEVPSGATFRASFASAPEERGLEAAGWTRVGERTFAATLEQWSDARDLLAAAMAAGMAEFIPLFSGLDLTSAEAVGRQDAARLAAVNQAFVDWVARDEPEWS